MADFVVLGAGSIGANIALIHAKRGESVRMVTRSGSGPAHPLIERVRGDASDATQLTRFAEGSKVIYQATNPSNYTLWEKLLPPLQAAAIAAAKANDATLAITGSLYAYGRQPGGRIHEGSPLSATGRKGRLRKRLWEEALAGGMRALEVRGSDYIGRGAQGLYSLVFGPALEKGTTAWVPGHLDMPHTFTYNKDMASALVTLAADARAWGKAWHVPSPPAITLRDFAQSYARAAGKPPLKLKQMPRFIMRTAGLFVPIAREMAEMDYQWYEPFKMDARLTEETFGLKATDLGFIINEEFASPSR